MSYDQMEFIANFFATVIAVFCVGFIFGASWQKWRNGIGWHILHKTRNHVPKWNTDHQWMLDKHQEIQKGFNIAETLKDRPLDFAWDKDRFKNTDDDYAWIGIPHIKPSPPEPKPSANPPSHTEL